MKEQDECKLKKNTGYIIRQQKDMKGNWLLRKEIEIKAKKSRKGRSNWKKYKSE